MNFEFTSDNTAPATSDIVASALAANVGNVLSYGDDPWTAELIVRATDAFAAPQSVGIVPILSGKLANHLSLASITEPGGLIFCHERAHIRIDEFDGPAYVTRCHVVGLPGDHDKLSPATLRAAIAGWGRIPANSALSLTNATEAGACYAPDELSALTSIAHGSGLLVHLDGARLSNAAAALRCSLADITWRAGIDIVSLGATKNGGMSAEAVVAFDPEIAKRLAARQLLFGHFPSKMRFLSAQLIAWFEQDGWRSRALHANAMARELWSRLETLGEFELVQPIQTNMIFVTTSPGFRERIAGAGYYVYDLPVYGEHVVRFVTSWTTTIDVIEHLVGALTSAPVELLAPLQQSG